MKNVLLDTQIKVPIYALEFSLIVARDPVSLHRNLRRFDRKDYGEWRALCIYDDEAGIFGVLFHADLTSNELAHEIKHLADEMMKWVGCARADEPKAYLIGWLTETVNKRLKRAGIKVR